MPGAAVTALFLALVAQFGAVVHMGLVRHQVCAEHGELVEADQSSSSSPPPSSPPTTPPSPAHSHDHCLLATHPAAVRSVVLGVAVDREGHGSLVEPREVAPVATAPRFSSLPLLAVAPKTSPPV